MIRSQDLTNQGKNFFLKNPEEYFGLSKYNIAVKDQVFWTYRENFVLIIRNFLDNILDFDEFETAFSLLYEEVRKEIDVLTIDFEQINKFHPSTRLYRFASVIRSIYCQFEEVKDEYYTEQEVKDYVKEIYLKFQNFEE